MKNLKGIKQGVRGGLGGGEGRVLSPSVVWSAMQVSYFVISESCMFFVLFSDLLRAIRLLQFRCFDIVFQSPYRYFSIVLKMFFSSSNRFKIFTSNWRWIATCENGDLSKIDITMKTINKQNGN